QYSFVNYDNGYFNGFEWGFINVAQETHGLQLGFFNYANELHGVQLGFANVASNNEWFSKFPDQLAKGFVFLNWSF
ncbi:MAG TPA: hypothetical protein VMH87_04885, partial [Pseudomonadales bacterium]|nr:hypothetical protein [Pseudomonadales bacterium]